MLAWLLLAVGDAHHAEQRVLAQLRQERTSAHTAALRAVSARLAGLEALPPELLARTLAEVAAVYPEWARLLVCDAAGRVLAAEPKRDTALVGALDPSAERRDALVNASPGAAFARARVGAGGGVELGVAQPGLHVRYVAGDLPEASLVPHIDVAPTSARVIASWALATFAVLFTAGAAVISSKRRP